MAITERTVIVANPARKRKTKMAKRLSLKQKLHFGSKAVRAAAKRSMKAKRSKARHAPRTKPNPSRKRAAARKQVKRRKVARKSTPRRSNPGEIIALTLGNPARRSSKKAMAKTKRRRKASAPRSNPAGRRRKSNPGRRRHSVRRNPAGFGMQDMLALGAGAVLGSSLPKLGSQMVLGSKNTGFMGYAANIAGTAILAWGAAKFLPRQRSLAAGILAGGIGQVIARAIGDYTQFGQYLNGAGMGDYMASNWVTPQRLPDALNSAMAENGYQAPQIVMASAAGGAGVGSLIGAPLY